MTWVHEKIYAAGGTHVPSTWSAFSDQTGIKTVLHLGGDGPSWFEGPPPDVFLWMKVEKEREAGLEERMRAARFIHDNLLDGRAVLLHSSQGRHRTRWAYVAYCLYAGRKLKPVLREAAERPWMSPYITDELAWEAFAALLNAGPENHRQGEPQA